MGQDCIGKSIERLLQSADDLIEAQESIATSWNRDPVDAFNKTLQAFGVNVHRFLSPNGSKDVELACAKTWINAFFELKLALRIELLLANVREKAEAATSGGETSRFHAYKLIPTTGQAAFALLGHSASLATALYQRSRSKAGKRKGLEALTAMAQRSFMKAVADVIGSMSTLRATAGEPSQPASASAVDQYGRVLRFTGSATAHIDGVGSLIADEVCKYTWAMAVLSRHHVDAPQGRSADMPAITVTRAITVTPEASSILGSLAESGLLAAAAAAVVDCPYVVGVAHDSISGAGRNAARAFVSVAVMQHLLWSHGGPEGRRLACRLLRATRHVAVRRLQVALLDQLAAHAGMGAELGGGEEGREEEEEEEEQRGEQQNEQAQEQGQQAHGHRGSGAQEQQEPPMQVQAQGEGAKEPEAGVHQRPGGRGQQQKEQAHGQQARGARLGQEQADGWEGSSGEWWFAREEAQRGQLLGLPEGEWGADAVKGSQLAGWLEGRHCNVISATLLDWQAAEEQHLAAEAGVPAAPPPLLRARLATRAAEALCRLCRGQGLGGVYGPAPQWVLSTVQLMVLSLLPKMEDANSLPPVTARACLPYWLEAAGWAAALMSDATAAAMGRLPSTERDEHSVHMLSPKGAGDPPAVTLLAVLARINNLAIHKAYGYRAVSSAAYRDARRRLYRCGLAASLDHTLRLAYSAQDGGQADVASRFQDVTRVAGLIADLGLAPQVPPDAEEDDVSSGDGGGDREGGSCDAPAENDGAREASGSGGSSADGGQDRGGGRCCSSAGSDGMKEATGSTGSGGGGSSMGRAGNRTGGSGCGSSMGQAGSNKGGIGGGSSSPGADGGPGGMQQAGAQQAGGGGSCSGAGGPGAETGNQLGLVYTLSKRAAMLTRALEAGAQGGDGLEQGDQARRQELMGMASEVLAALRRVLTDVEDEVEWSLQEAGGKGAEWAGDAAGAPDSVCVDEAHEALALAARAACNMAAAYAWQLAADLAREPTAVETAAAGPAVQLTKAQAEGATAVREVLRCLLRLCMSPPLLPPAQLLACQPHRLLTAACALPAESECQAQDVGDVASMLIVAMASHKALSGWVRSWLAPPPSAAAAVSTSCSGSACGGHGGGSCCDACAGCLAAPVRCAVRLSPDSPSAAPALALLQFAAGEVAGPGEDAPCCPGGGGDGAAEEADADGAFQRHAAALYEEVMARPKDEEPLLPDDSGGTDLSAEKEVDAESSEPQPLQPVSAPSWPLPPRLVLPPSRAGALPRLRMCGNPWCCNFGGDCEWALRLKQCAGCRAVRYCGADCQRAHWREGHRAECKALAAGAESS